MPSTSAMKIVNMVATATTSTPFDLEKLKLALKGSEQAATGAKWLKMRLPEGNEYVAFYQSGKFLITGVKSIEAISDIVGRVKVLLKSAGLDIVVEKVQIHNVVVSDRVDIRGSLEKIFIEHGELTASYEPEQFPALMIHGSGCTYLLFSSGKVICAGNKTIGLAQENIQWLKEQLKGS